MQKDIRQTPDLWIGGSSHAGACFVGQMRNLTPCMILLIVVYIGCFPYTEMGCFPLLIDIQQSGLHSSDMGMTFVVYVSLILD